MEEGLDEQYNAMSELGAREGGDMEPPPEVGAVQQGLGGPGIDTPQEQQAIQLIMQGAMAFRKATEVDPSLRGFIDPALQKAYLDITKHYGLEEEGKTALKQAQLQSNRERSSRLTARPPVGGAPLGGGPQM